MPAARPAARRYETRPVATMTEVETAWLAALIDGEGHIKVETLHREWGQRNYRYVRILVVNTCLPLLERGEAITNSGRITKRRLVSSRHTQLYVWQVCGKRATQILEQILPYLIAKRERAIDAISWLEGGELSSLR